nr:MAG TPA: hypothetical protein [Caudoviricetes sp.]
MERLERPYITNIYCRTFLLICQVRQNVSQ